jgi:hypothetical protein
MGLAVNTLSIITVGSTMGSTSSTPYGHTVNTVTVLSPGLTDNAGTTLGLGEYSLFRRYIADTKHTNRVTFFGLSKYANSVFAFGLAADARTTVTLRVSFYTGTFVT